MRLKRLEVNGFKSFVDRTVLTFDHAVTCVVGPNGCGKSNIVDALRWVLGEQSAKQLRGRAMEDVIFNGCESRGPHGFAEVGVTFDNTDGLAPPEYRDYPEITVTRRLDREGHSEYLINRTSVRLLDVTNLFLGTGVGRRAYSTIEQGRIGLIVSAKPEDRRVIIEEAAGITKFKAKKRAAERKMEQTRQNLLRVTDIVTEIEKNLASLKRQAQKARRYRQYREEIRGLELWVGSMRWLELTGAHRVIAGQLTEAARATEEARAKLEVREAEFETERLALQEVGARVEREQTRAYELDNTVQLLQSQGEHHEQQLKNLREREAAAKTERERLAGQREQLERERLLLSGQLEGLQETQAEREASLADEHANLDEQRAHASEAERALRAARERLADARSRRARAEVVLSSFETRQAEMKRRLERLGKDRETLEQRIAEMSEQATEQAACLEGLRGGKAELGSRKAELEAELVLLREQSRQSEHELDQRRSEFAAKRSRLHSLEELQQRFEGVGAGVRAVMTRFGHDPAALHQAGVLGLVADRIQCPEDLTRALAAALADRMEHIVVRDIDAGVEAVRYLSESQRGRAALVPARPWLEPRDRPAPPEREGVLGYIDAFVHCEDEDRQLVHALLRDFLVVQDLETALRLHREQQLHREQPWLSVVSLDGHVLDASGRITGGQGDDAGEHMLALMREVRELHGVVAALDTRLSRAVERHRDLRTQVAQRQAALEVTRNDAHQTEIAMVKAERDQKRAADAAEESRSRLSRLIAEIGEVGASIDRALVEQTQGSTGCEAARVAEAAALHATREADAVHAQRRGRAEEQSARVTELRVGAARAREQVEASRAAVERISRSVSELDARAERLRRDAAGFSARQGEVSGRIFAGRDTLSVRVREAMEARDALKAQRANYDQAQEALAESELGLRQLRGSIDDASRAQNELRVKERETALELQHLLEQAEDRHRVDLRLELIEHHARGIPEVAVTQRIDELHAVVSRMGEINLTAIEEYEERKQRHQYLTEQRADLETALAQLDKAIRQMNRESRRLFRETFDAVNQRFQKTFPHLFGGGRAELRLTNPEDLLETGVEIVAMPPGKKLGSIDLMSGGEKALTAVALIFAVFQYKPSPFCLLDEVDAPLDEANVSRFNEMVRQMTDRSQFILITHHKRTMELSDVLYGVTMETAGISKLVSVELTDREIEPVAVPEQEAVAFA